MPTINPTFAQKIYDLTAFAYQHKIDCPPLIGINNWITAQSTPGAGAKVVAGLKDAVAFAGGDKSRGRMTTPKKPATISAADKVKAAYNKKLDAAVLSVVRSSTNGILVADLPPTLAQLTPKPTQGQINASLGRVSASKSIVKRGDLWYGRTNGKIDDSMPARRATRAKAAKATTARRARQPRQQTNGEAQQQPGAAD